MINLCGTCRKDVETCDAHDGEYQMDSKMNVFGATSTKCRTKKQKGWFLVIHTETYWNVWRQLWLLGLSWAKIAQWKRYGNGRKSDIIKEWTALYFTSITSVLPQVSTCGILLKPSRQMVKAAGFDPVIVPVQIRGRLLHCGGIGHSSNDQLSL